MEDEERRRLKARFRKLCADSGYPEDAAPGASLRDDVPPPATKPWKKPPREPDVPLELDGILTFPPLEDSDHD